MKTNEEGESPTPRTDKAGIFVNPEELLAHGWIVPADFARQLERETATLTARVGELEGENQQAKALLMEAGKYAAPESNIRHAIWEFLGWLPATSPRPSTALNSEGEGE